MFTKIILVALSLLGANALVAEYGRLTNGL